MKYINVRQLLHTFNEATSELPVIVTKSGLPIFIILPMDAEGPAEDWIKQPIELKVAEKISKKIAEENEEAVRDMYPLGYCNFPFCNKFAVATKDGKNYCKEHK